MVGKKSSFSQSKLEQCMVSDCKKICVQARAHKKMAAEAQHKIQLALERTLETLEKEKVRPLMVS